jgi:hypothetical protein
MPRVRDFTGASVSADDFYPRAASPDAGTESLAA